MGYKTGRRYRPRLTKRVRDRLRRLLPMEYTVHEVAEVLGVAPDTLYRGWIPGGAPHRRDEQTGLLWIVGTDLAAWLREHIHKSGVKLAAGEGFCMRCQQAVALAGSLERQALQRAILVRGTCPQCGNTVARLESPNDQPEKS